MFNPAPGVGGTLQFAVFWVRCAWFRSSYKAGSDSLGY